MFVFTDNELKNWKKECKTKIRELKSEILKLRHRIMEIHSQERLRKENKLTRRNLTQVCKKYGLTLAHDRQRDTYMVGISDKNIAKHFGGVNPLTDMLSIYYDPHILLKDIQDKVLPLVSKNV